MQFAQNLEERKYKGQCCAEGCWKPAAKKQILCHKHKKDQYKEKHLHQYYLSDLKQRAKRRGKSCSLTLAQFKEFCDRTGYLRKKGVNIGDSHIDRIDPTRGYDVDNIQILTNLENLKKKYADTIRTRLMTWKEPTIDTSDIVQTPKPSDEEAPF
jgi:hypothetical protein